MRSLRTIAYVSIALLLVSMLAIGAVSAKPGEGGKNKMWNNNGVCPTVRPDSTVQVTGLSEAEKASLIYMREEEKLARDVYLSLYNKWRMPIFKNIAMSEQKHMDAVKSLLTKYGVADPAAKTSVGKFTNTELQGLYNQLVKQGSVSREGALKVGVLIEEVDIRDLKAGIDSTKHSDIKNVYTNLLQGSKNHLSAFNKLLGK